MKKDMINEFENHMIPFWKHMIDREYGGYYGLLDYSLKLDKNADKGCILNSRILWFFSNAAVRLNDSDYMTFADEAYDFLQKHFIDKEYGGVYWSVSYDGLPSDETKHTYNQSFAIYALSSYYEASKIKASLETAYELFDIVESKCRDKDGYLEAFNRFFEKASNEKLSENGVEAGRTMNTLLHLMEAYTELYRVDTEDILGKRQEVKDRIVEMLNIFRNKVFNPKKERLEVFFDLDYNTLIDLHSYGHDIESAWLIDRTVDVLNEFSDGRSKYDMSDITKVLTKKIYEVAFRENGMPAECEKGNVLETRVWWVQCEAIIGFLNGIAYSDEKGMLVDITEILDSELVPDFSSEIDAKASEKTDNTLDYLRAAISIWKYTKEYMIDSRSGSEWFAEVGLDGKPFTHKAILDPWKCPYHNGRMYMEILERLGGE
ncbi:MAG: AGE family epimerase/isomerase [Eubacterium sp.]|nr:AGE family epimerase/isomerase [Eubacterium sp.]